MTVSTTTREVVLETTGATTEFPFNFRVLDADHLTVQRRVVSTGLVDKTYTASEYSLTGVGTDSGSVTISPALASGYEIVITRTVDYKQELDIVNQGGFYPESVEEQLDLLVMQVQQLAAAVGRSIVVAPGSSLDELGPADIRANQYLLFDANGQPSLSEGTGSDTGIRGDLASTTSGKGIELVAGAIRPALTRANMAAFNTNKWTRARLFEAGREGLFSWNSADLSAYVTLDPAQGVYVPPTSDTTGASGAWVRETRGAEVWVEWFGAKGDYNSGTNTGTDDTAAINAAFDYASLTGILTLTKSSIPVVRLQARKYLISNLAPRWNQQIIGMDRHSTSLWVKDGTSGVVMGVADNESPQKVLLRGFAIYCRDIATVTHILKLDSSAPASGSGQHGTEGGLFDLWLRDAPEAVGLQLDGNVSYFDHLTIESCKIGLYCLGTANMGGTLTLMQIGESAGTPSEARALKISGCSIANVHIEAPVSGSIPIEFTRGDCAIGSLKVSVTPATTYPAFIHADSAHYTTWRINHCHVYNPGNATIGTAVLRYGNVDTSSFTNSLGTSLAVLNAGEPITYRRAVQDRRTEVEQEFMIRLINTTGATPIQHRIGCAVDSGTAGKLHDRITGASTALIDTPTGTDGSTAFANGAKISSVTPSILILDVADQVKASASVTANIISNSTGTDYTIWPQFNSRDVNGVTRVRLELQLIGKPGSSGVNWASALGDGQLMDIQVRARLA